MGTKRCTCDRDVPPGVLWRVLAENKSIRCSGCDWKAHTSDLLALVDDEAQPMKLRAAIVAYVQTARYGSTSADGIRNAIPSIESKVVGGLLAGLVRAGLLERCGNKNLSVAAMIVERPAFVPGPIFPKVTV